MYCVKYSDNIDDKNNHNSFNDDDVVNDKINNGVKDKKITPILMIKVMIMLMIKSMNKIKITVKMITM